MSEARKKETHLLSVTGMSCAGCVRSVENALGSVPGVQLATVNFAGQTAAVTGDTSSDTLIRAIEDAGYSAKELVDESIDELEAEAASQLKTAITRSGIALLGGVLLMADMKFRFLPSLEDTFSWTIIGLFTLVAMSFAGGHFFRGAFSAARHASFTMDTLIALGTGAAWIYSMVVVLLPDAMPDGSRHQFFEAALFIIGFVNLGKALEMNARSGASLAIQKLFDLTPPLATVIEAGEERLVAVSEVQQGQVLLVRPGENFPVDGEVISGETTINESLLTGESEPVYVSKGASVHAGTINVDGAVEVRVVDVGESTRLGAITRLVNEAQNSKPPVARLVDQVTSVFVPLVLVIAATAFCAWWVFGPEPQLSFAFVAMMSVLIIACPCALGLAVPMSVMIGIGRAAAAGILVRNSEVLQAASKVDVVLLDKTGTLTAGKPMVRETVGLNDEHLAVVLGLEQSSSHPLASAITAECRRQMIEPAQVSDFMNHIGGGVSGVHGGKAVKLGSMNFLRDQGVTNLPDISAAGTVVAFAINESYCGHFLLADEVRESVPEIIQSMISSGIRVVMLTGDRISEAERVAGQAGISEIHAEVSPEGKLALVKQLQDQGCVVAMVGDGINDSAALSAANVGIAMGMGSDVALESADVTLRNNTLEGVEQTIRLSRRVLANIRQNLVAAFSYNALLIPVAAGVLYPFTGWLISPSLAGLAMALSSVTVVLNAGRLRF